MVSFSSFLNDLSSLFLHGPWCGRGGKGGGGENSHMKGMRMIIQRCVTHYAFCIDLPFHKTLSDKCLDKNIGFLS